MYWFYLAAGPKFSSDKLAGWGCFCRVEDTISQPFLVSQGSGHSFYVKRGGGVQKIIMENTTLDPRKHRRPETDLFFYHTFLGEVFRSLCLAASLTGVPMSFDTSRLVIFQGIITHHRWKKDMIRELGREGLRVRACFSGTLSPPVLPEPSEWLFSSLCPRKKKKHESVPIVICWERRY